MSIELKPDANGFRYVLLWLNFHIESKEDADQSYLIEWADFVRDARDKIECLQAERNNDLKGRLDALSDDQRLELFGRYCAHCGCKQPESGMRCQCWNDE